MVAENSSVSSDPARHRSTVVERRPLGRQIADALRRDILFGNLEPGTSLSQQALCVEFGTSRMPVRDALRQLVYEGLLVDGRQPTVARLSRDDLRDIFLVEGILHGLAAKRATERATSEDLQELRSLHERMLEAEQDDDPDRMAEINWEFHRRINRLSRSRKLMAAIRAISIDMPRDYLVAFPVWMTRSNEQHAQMLDAMERGEGDTVETLALDHLRTSGDDLIEYLDSRGLLDLEIEYRD